VSNPLTAVLLDIAQSHAAALRRQMQVTSRRPGYAHEIVEGTCGPDVTVSDIRRTFYDPYFGGRDAWVRDGHFGCVVHTD
jgi:hypothetical protein